MDNLQRVICQQIINRDELRSLSVHNDNLEDYIIRYTKHKMVEELIDKIPWNIERTNDEIKVSYDLILDEYSKFIEQLREITCHISDDLKESYK